MKDKSVDQTNDANAIKNILFHIY